MISGLQTDSDTGNMLSPDPKRMVLIAQCCSESTRQAAKGGREQYGEGERGKHDNRKEKEYVRHEDNPGNQD